MRKYRDDLEEFFVSLPADEQVAARSRYPLPTIRERMERKPRPDAKTVKATEKATRVKQKATVSVDMFAHDVQSAS